MWTVSYSCRSVFVQDSAHSSYSRWISYCLDSKPVLLFINVSSGHHMQTTDKRQTQAFTPPTADIISTFTPRPPEHGDVKPVGLLKSSRAASLHITTRHNKQHASHCMCNKTATFQSSWCQRVYRSACVDLSWLPFNPTEQGWFPFPHRGATTCGARVTWRD